MDCPAGLWEQVPAGRWGCSPEGPVSGSWSLRHLYDNAESGCDFIVFTHDPVADSGSCTFSFRVRHGYPPSSSNNWQVAFLASFSAMEGIKGAVEERSGGAIDWISEGLVLGVNLTGADDLLKLWQYVKGNCYEICSTSLDYQNEVGMEGAPLISMHISEEGEVSIDYSGDPGHDAMIRVGGGNLLGWPGGRQLAVRYQYSSSRDRMLWLDDLQMTGAFQKDTMPPGVLEAEVTDGEYVRLVVSEPVMPVECASFHLYGPSIGLIDPVACSAEGNEMVLRFPGELPNREIVELQVGDLCDPDGNCLTDTVVLLRRNDAVWGDVVFNELMTDPGPAVQLPELEYMELYNRSAEETDLEGWSVEVNNREYLITPDMMEPGCRLIPGAYGILKGISLPNQGATLALYSESGTLVHAVSYRIPWREPVWKHEGGWSLESPDPERVCGISGLWGYSNDPKGGTPGQVNSLDAEVADDDPPVLLYAGLERRLGVFALYFSEPVRHSFWEPGYFPLMFDGGQSDGVNPDSVAPGLPLGERVDLWLPDAIQGKDPFRVKLPVLVDCSGNLCLAREASGGSPLPPGEGGILINEIMYDPQDWAPEYIELYNPGQRYYDLMDLCLDAADAGDPAGHPVPICGHSRLIPPGAYLVVTGNTDHLMEAYNLELSGQWVEMDPWVGLNNAGGTLYLTDRTGKTVDMAPFGDQMHMELVSDTRGVSLERIESAQPGSDPGNWHSAASIAGYATPGEPNSQRAEGSAGEGILKVSPKVFSPDNDGHEDLLEITLSPGGHGWTVHLRVTDLEGRTVRTLANNHLLGTGSLYWWDGEQEDGRMVFEGIYIVHAWGYHSVTKKRWSRKEAVGVVYR